MSEWPRSSGSAATASLPPFGGIVSSLSRVRRNLEPSVRIAWSEHCASPRPRASCCALVALTALATACKKSSCSGVGSAALAMISQKRVTKFGRAASFANSCVSSCALSRSFCSFGSRKSISSSRHTIRCTNEDSPYSQSRCEISVLEAFWFFLLMFCTRYRSCAKTMLPKPANGDEAIGASDIGPALSWLLRHARWVCPRLPQRRPAPGTVRDFWRCVNLLKEDGPALPPPGLTQSVSQSVISRFRPALTPPPARSPTQVPSTRSRGLLNYSQLSQA